jgi:MGT family glycosyltransferase
MRPSGSIDFRTGPTVYVTLGTVFNELSVFRVLLDALAGVDCNAIATVGPRSDPTELAPFPDNAHVERYISQSLVLPRSSVAVTPGGSGSTLAALAHGLPMLVVPQGADQFDNAAQCAALGASRVLVPSDVSTEAVRAAVVVLLEDPSYSERAGTVAAEVAAMPDPEELVSTLAAAAAPA